MVHVYKGLRLKVLEFPHHALYVRVTQSCYCASLTSPVILSSIALSSSPVSLLVPPQSSYTYTRYIQDEANLSDPPSFLVRTRTAQTLWAQCRELLES